MQEHLSKNTTKGDVLRHGSHWSRYWYCGGVHVLDVVGGRRERGVLSTRNVSHAVPDSHVVELSVRNYKTILKQNLCLDMNSSSK